MSREEDKKIIKGIPIDKIPDFIFKISPLRRLALYMNKITENKLPLQM